MINDVTWRGRPNRGARWVACLLGAHGASPSVGLALARARRCHRMLPPASAALTIVSPWSPISGCWWGRTGRAVALRVGRATPGAMPTRRGQLGLRDRPYDGLRPALGCKVPENSKRNRTHSTGRTAGGPEQGRIRARAGASAAWPVVSASCITIYFNKLHWAREPSSGVCCNIQ